MKIKPTEENEQKAKEMVRRAQYYAHSIHSESRMVVNEIVLLLAKVDALSGLVEIPDGQGVESKGDGNNRKKISENL